MGHPANGVIRCETCIYVGRAADVSYPVECRVGKRGRRGWVGVRLDDWCGRWVGHVACAAGVGVKRKTVTVRQMLDDPTNYAILVQRKQCDSEE